MKKLFSIFLAFILILSILTMPAFAQSSDEEVSVDRLVFWLHNECLDYMYTFMYNNCIESDKESKEEFSQIFNEAWDFCMTFEDGGEATAEEVISYFAKLDEAAKKIIIVPQELKYLIDCCKLEKNDDLYYPAELWDDFQSKIAVAEEVYNKGETTIEVSNAYWDLLFSFNDICTVNTLEGDIDFDGELSVLDATIVQRAVAGLCEFNSSQLTALGFDVSIINATNIQRAAVKLQHDVISYSLPSLIEDSRKRFLDNNNIFYEYREQFMPYNGLDQDNIHHPNLP